MFRRLNRLNYRCVLTIQGDRHLHTTTNTNNIIRSPVEDIQVPNITIPELVFQKFGNWPNKIAIECAATGKKYTFEEIRVKSKNLSASLSKKLGLSKGDVIGILLPNTPEYPVCVLGALEAGLVVTTVNPLYTIDEVKRQLLKSETKVIITFTTLVPLIQKTGLQIPIIATRLNAAESLPEGALCFDELVETSHYKNGPTIATNADDVAVMPSSGGTTGYPKLAEITHRNIVSNLCQTYHPYFRIAEETTSNHQDVIPAVLPFFHIYGLVSILLSSLYNTCKLVSLPKFHPGLYINTLANHKPHILLTVPHMVTFLTNSPDVKKEHFESVRTIFSSAAPLGPLDEEKLLQKVQKPIDFIQAYGLTEASPCVAILDAEKRRQLGCSGSVGELIPNTFLKVVDITDSTCAPLGPNYPGEILIKGPQVIKKYHKQPKETESSFVDGWFKTGDVGFYDDNKMIYITDRLKDIIKVKGFQVAPAEIEEIIRDHPLVNDAGVIGIPDKTFGEVPRAYIVLKENKKVSSEEIQQYVAEKIADYKQIRGGVVVVDSLPKTAAGKILRRELKALYKKEAL